MGKDKVLKLLIPVCIWQISSTDGFLGKRRAKVILMFSILTASIFWLIMCHESKIMLCWSRWPREFFFFFLIKLISKWYIKQLHYTYLDYYTSSDSWKQIRQRGKLFLWPLFSGKKCEHYEKCVNLKIQR